MNVKSDKTLDTHPTTRCHIWRQFHICHVIYFKYGKNMNASRILTNQNAGWGRRWSNLDVVSINWIGATKTKSRAIYFYQIFLSSRATKTCNHDQFCIIIISVKHSIHAKLPNLPFKVMWLSIAWIVDLITMILLVTVLSCTLCQVTLCPKPSMRQINYLKKKCKQTDSGAYLPQKSSSIIFMTSFKQFGQFDNRFLFELG